MTVDELREHLHIASQAGHGDKPVRLGQVGNIGTFTASYVDGYHTETKDSQWFAPDYKVQAVIIRGMD